MRRTIYFRGHFVDSRLGCYFFIEARIFCLSGEPGNPFGFILPFRVYDDPSAAILCPTQWRCWRFWVLELIRSFYFVRLWIHCGWPSFPRLIFRRHGIALRVGASTPFHICFPVKHLSWTIHRHRFGMACSFRGIFGSLRSTDSARLAWSKRNQNIQRWEG